MSTATLETLRQAELAELITALESQKARAADIVMDAHDLKFEGTRARIEGVKDVILDADGVTDLNGLYVPTSVADEGLSEKLEIPLPWLRKNRLNLPYLYQEDLNAWLQRDDRRFLLRLLRTDGEEEGILRAVLSAQYQIIDNFSVVLAALKGIKEAGVENTIIDADLTERRMIVRVTVPELAIYAEEFLKSYRNPFDGSDAGRGWTPERLRQAALAEGHDVQDKVIFAGLVITNSEVGEGAFRMTPRLVIGPCTNGLQLTAEALIKTHLGAKLDPGPIQWSKDTMDANLTLITNQATDVARSCLDLSFMQEQVDKLQEEAKVKVRKAPEVIADVSKKLGFTKTQANDILNHFISGGQRTVGGVMQAITSVAQTIPDGDVAFAMERVAVTAMRHVREADKRLASVTA